MTLNTSLKDILHQVLDTSHLKQRSAMIERQISNVKFAASALEAFRRTQHGRRVWCQAHAFKT